MEKNGKGDIRPSPVDLSTQNATIAERPIPASPSVDGALRDYKTTCSLLNLQLKSSLESNSLQQAEYVSRTILDLHRMALPDDDEAVLLSKMNLAGIYQKRSKFEEAEKLQEETLAKMKEKLGENHQFTIQCKVNQAETFASRGRTEAAVRLLERTLQILPADASQAPTVKSSLATKLASLGKLEDAKIMFTEVMKTRQKNLGPMHPDTLCTRANLAGVYFHLGAWKLVQNIATSLLPALENKLSVEHPYTMSCRRYLALSLQNQGEYSGADKLFSKLLCIQHQVHGEEHIETFNCKSDMASLYKDMGRYEEAEELQNLAANSLEKIVGKDHPDTLYSKVGLIGIYTGQGRYEEAVNLGRLLVEQTEHALGKQHTTTLSCLQNLALVYGYQDRFQEAERLERQVLEGMAMLDKNHPDALTARANLALTCFELGKYDEAKELFANGEGMLCNEDPAALTRLHNVSFVLSKSGLHDEAVAIAKHVVQVRVRKFGNDKLETMVAKSSLAMAYRGQGNHEKALGLLQESTSTISDMLGPKDRTTLINLFNLALVLFESGRIDLAEDGCNSIVEDLKHKLGSAHDTYVQCIILLSRIKQMREDAEI